MTLHQLRLLLAAIPSDCDSLPVYFSDRDNGLLVRVILVDPPGNAEGMVPCVTLGAELVGMVKPEALLIETRRLPGWVPGDTDPKQR